MKKITVFLFSTLFIIQLLFNNSSVYAVSAYPYPIEFVQPDGSKITILLKGDEKIRWAETTDHYSILFNAKGTYEYAVTDNIGNMVPSGIQAHNIAIRTSEENVFLASIPYSLHFSNDQILMMKNAWNIASSGPQQAFPTTGNRNLLCILIGFKDLAFTKTQAEFNNLFNQIHYSVNGSTGSVKDYYLENSYNQLNLSITVVGPFTASDSMAYYGANSSGSDIRPRELISEAVTLADPVVNYTNFDNDNDGTVDGVYVIHSGYDEAAGAPSYTIWAHAWDLLPTLTLDGKIISRYSTSSELNGTTGSIISNIGVICHEYGHVLGAPDFYDVDYGTGGQYKGTAHWDVMAAGNWNNDSKTPAHHNPYTKTRIYNWATVTTLSSCQNVTLQNSAENSNSFYRYSTSTANEFFLLENKQQIKFDSAAPGHGLIIYHVDSTYIAAHDNSASGANFNTINATSHQGFYPVCAIATGNPPTIYGPIDSSGCSFPGSSNITSFTDATTPNSLSWAGTNTNKPITNITENNVTKTISFTFSSSATNISGTISANTTLGIGCSPYTITSSLTVNPGVTLTIDSGVVVKFANNQGLTVLGTLTATDVTFTSSSATPTPGIWGLLQTGNAASTGTVNLTGCQIEYAQYFNVFKGTATLSNTNLSNFSLYGAAVQTAGILNMTNGNINTNHAAAAASGHGVYAFGQASLNNVNIQHFANGVYLNLNSNVLINNSTITNCTWPVYYVASADLSSAGVNILTGNTYSAVNVSFSALTDTITLPFFNNVPYYFPGGMYINSGGKMTITSGCVLKFALATLLDVNGTLIANANPAEYIYFTSIRDDSWNGDSNNDGVTTTPASGNWYGVRFNNSSIDANCILNRSRVRYAGYNSTGALYFENSSPTISSCEVSLSYSGIYINTGGSPIISSISITSCTYPYLYVAEGNITLSGVNTYTTNTNNYAFLDFINVYTLLGLPKITIPYVSNQGLYINTAAKFKIESGNIIKMYANKAIDIYGKINANAVFGENIYFTSIKDDSWGGDNNADGATTTPASGNWYGIRFFDSSIDTACLLNACKIRYAGYGYTGGLQFTNSSPTISNCEVTYSYSGIYILMGGAPFVSNIILNYCTYPYLYVAEGNITLTGTQTYTGNTHNYALLNFTQVYILLGLPTITIPYVSDQSLVINTSARFVVDNNNIIKFYQSQYVNVFGKMYAKANSGSNIYFTSIKDDNWGGDSNEDGILTAPASNNWYGIRFYDSSIDTACYMKLCNLRYAGQGNQGGVSMWDASPTIDSCIFTNCYHGIYVANASNPILTNNLIGSSQMTPLAMSFEADPVFTNNTFSFSDNSYDAIGLISGSLTANAILKIRSVTSIPNVTYLILGDITVPAGIQLTINKNIVIKSYYYTHKFIVNGTMNANATADSMITFTSAKDDNYGNPADCNKDGTITSPVVGDWGGIIFNSGSTGILNYCRIKYSRIPTYSFTNCSVTEYINDAGLAMIDASPTISNCEFKDLTYGISCYRVSNPIISNNSMINIQYTPFCISSSSNPNFIGNTFTNIGQRAIGLLGGQVCLNGTIKKRNVAGFTNITYIMLSNMTINSGAYVSVDSGVVIKMNSNNIYVDGGFRTNGTIGQRVIFTSIKDDNEGNPFDSNGDGNATTPLEGNWGSIYYRSTSDDAYCLINYTTLKYAGSTGIGCVTFENAGGTIKNSTISNSSNYGVYCNGNSNPLIDSVIIQNCNLDPIAMSLTSNPILTNISFISNYSQAIKIIEGTLSTNATLISRNVAGITNIAYIIDQLTISTNAKLIIQPDVVIKFRGSSYSCITVNGNLIAKGLNTHRIHFTSFKDDSKGGDSNNDGNVSTPSKGDWGYYYGGLRFIDNSINSDTVNSLKNCEISYAYTGFRAENSHATIDSCTIQQCSAYGATIMGSANPDIRNTQFYNIVYSPIELSMFSNPVFSNCNASNVGYMAISVIPETYSQSASIPIRNFGGYNNISYYLEGTNTINSGTTITVPAGIVFKSSAAYGFSVNGRLNIQGTAANPVIFTNDKDDNYGNPGDMNQNGSATVPNTGAQGWGGTWITFNDVSDDSSSIKNVIFKYGNIAINTLSASPSIDSVLFENHYYGIDMNGVSAPKINNCIFNNLRYYPIQISLVSFPASSSNNLISGSTYKMIKVRDETLTQDVTLPKRNFGGLTNIPYLFSGYAIGTGATLTINPGVVCKFTTGSFDVNKGLIAIGGSTPETNIVFTDYRDDFYGGDSNADTTLTSAAYSWQGINFNDQSLDPLCQLSYCIIRFANYGVKTVSASPTLLNCHFTNNNNGVYAQAASNPVINYCDFDDNYYFAVNNVNKSFVINAENCWWGNTLGPIQTNTAGNGTSTQEIVSTSVDFTPWLTNGNYNPIAGDVSLNGYVQAYDASLILKYAVSSYAFSPTQLTVGDVSANGTVTAFDASLILRYVVNIIQYFPSELLKSSINPVIPTANLNISNASVMSNDEFSLAVDLTNVSDLQSTDLVIKYDPNYLEFIDVDSLTTLMNASYRIDSLEGKLYLAFAGTADINTDNKLLNLRFKAKPNSNNNIYTSVKIESFVGNETNLLASSVNGMVTINSTTGIITVNNQNGIINVFPNPINSNASISYMINGEKQEVKIIIVNLLGQKVKTLVDKTLLPGKYDVQWNATDDFGQALNTGYYFLYFTTNDQSISYKIQINR